MLPTSNLEYKKRGNIIIWVWNACNGICTLYCTKEKQRTGFGFSLMNTKNLLVRLNAIGRSIGPIGK